MKAGFVALVGRPNAGKSTLLNRLVGQKVAIVSDRAPGRDALMASAALTRMPMMLRWETSLW